MNNAKKQENNRVGKTRDLFKKIGDTTGLFHAKIGTIKDKNSKDLTEAEEIFKRWQEYTEELYQTAPNDPDNHEGVVSHLQPDLLECEVKWAFGSIILNIYCLCSKLSQQIYKTFPSSDFLSLHSSCQ